MTNEIRIVLNAVLLAATLCLSSGCGSGGSETGTNPVDSASWGGEIAYGSATLSWEAPLYNSDGSFLIDLDGYRIYWGTTPGRYPNSVSIDNESVSIYVVENIPVGTYQFVVTSFNSAGIESHHSAPVTKTVP